MNIYYEKKKGVVKFLSFLVGLVFVVGIAGFVIYGLQEFKIMTYYKSYHNIILYGAIALVVFCLILLIIRKITNKRKNVRFDGQMIKFCVNNYVEHEFDLRKVDEIINYRTKPEITYGLADAIAFRFHKNEIWTTITSELYDSKHKKNSMQLIRDINQTYAHIKSQRAIKQMSSSQGVRFRQLSLAEDKTKDDYNEMLKKLEKTFTQYSNTYGDFDLTRLVVTNDSLYVNKDRTVTINEGDYIKVKSLHNHNDNYYTSEEIEFYNREDKLILTIDLTLVINAELFKTLCLSVFTTK